MRAQRYLSGLDSGLESTRRHGPRETADVGSPMRPSLSELADSDTKSDEASGFVDMDVDASTRGSRVLCPTRNAPPGMRGKGVSRWQDRARRAWDSNPQGR